MALTRLCVDLPSNKAPWVYKEAKDAPQQAMTVPDMVQELLQQVQEWPASLQQVEVWVSSDDTGAKRMCWQHTPAVPAGGRFTVWVEQREGKAAGWTRPLRPCPHLPGVWELQGQPQAVAPSYTMVTSE
jgi:hypothetical protein